MPPSAPEILDHANGSEVQHLYSEPTLQLTCVADMGRPAASIRWFRNEVEVTDNIEYTVTPIANDKRENARSVLTLRPKYPDDNDVQYTCQAYNNALVNGPLRTTVNISVLCK